MISQNLQNAIDNLQINDVYLAEVTAWTDEDFEPKYNSHPLTAEFKHRVKRSDIIEIDEKDKLLRVYIDLGVRWMIDSTEEDSEASTKAKIESTFIAEYLIKNEISAESQKEFSLNNASFHVWPYWRELVSSHSEKLRLPRLMLPTVQFASNQLHQEKSD